MKQQVVFFGLVAVLLWTGYGCGDEPLEPIPPEPVIELIAVAPVRIQALEDSVVFRLRYTDGDGDLGFVEADSAVVYLSDERFGLTEEFHVPPLAPLSAQIAITGVLDIVLRQTIMMDPLAAEEPVVFSLRIRDRAGNWSNAVQTQGLIVSRL